VRALSENGLWLHTDRHSSPGLNPAQALPFLLDLASDANPAVRVAAGAALDAVINADTDQEGAAARLRALRFEAHNQAWLAGFFQQQQQQQHWQQSAAVGTEELGRTLFRPGAALAARAAPFQEGSTPSGAGGADSSGAAEYGLYSVDGQQLVFDIQGAAAAAAAAAEAAAAAAAAQHQQSSGPTEEDGFAAQDFPFAGGFHHSALRDSGDTDAM
jgi:hypothetical protein